MYENEYEEYMRAVLGYPQMENTYCNRPYFPYSNEKVSDENQINKLYPEIYILLKPMVAKVCNNYRSYSIDESLLETMTMEIYGNIESEPNFEIDISKDDRAEINKINKSNAVSNSSTNIKVSENVRGCKHCNPLLKDLIKILILNQISNNNKPPRPPKPPMFPYPQAPGMGYPPGPHRPF